MWNCSQDSYNQCARFLLRGSKIKISGDAVEWNISDYMIDNQVMIKWWCYCPVKSAVTQSASYCHITEIIKSQDRFCCIQLWVECLAFWPICHLPLAHLPSVLVWFASWLVSPLADLPLQGLTLDNLPLSSFTLWLVRSLLSDLPLHVARNSCMSGELQWRPKIMFFGLHCA